MSLICGAFPLFFALLNPLFFCSFLLETSRSTVDGRAGGVGMFGLPLMVGNRTIGKAAGAVLRLQDVLGPFRSTVAPLQSFWKSAATL